MYDLLLSLVLSDKYHSADEALKLYTYQQAHSRFPYNM